jgi:RNase P subunit RPR2
MQVHKDTICSNCSSVNEYEHITKETTGNTILMMVRCKSCGHEQELSRLTAWSEPGCEPIKFEITDWSAQTPELY